MKNTLHSFLATDIAFWSHQQIYLFYIRATSKQFFEQNFSQKSSATCNEDGFPGVELWNRLVARHFHALYCTTITNTEKEKNIM